MAYVVADVEKTIGNTPLVRLFALEKSLGLKAKLMAKLEKSNPAGSIKDRAAKWMIDAAERDGLLLPGGTIIEPTSGNTGIGLAAIGIPRGYRVILTMPDTMSVERRSLLKAYGAQLVLTDGARGMAGAIEKAKELYEQTEAAYIPGQFENPANPAAHEATTGPEIWLGTDGAVDVLVAGVGTGGTITGAGRYLRNQNPDIHIVAVEPAASPVLSGGSSGPHPLQGIGAGFIPKVLDRDIYNEVIAVEGNDAYEMGRALVAQEGILAGVSSAAALCAAAEVARRGQYAEKTVVVILPDSGERYLSTPMFADKA